MTNTRNENLGYLFGLIAVVAFAVTLPARRAAVWALDPVFVGLGRGVGAALLGAAFLFLTRQHLPTRVRAGAGFHADPALRQIGHHFQQLGPANGLLEYRLAMRIHTMQTKYVFGQVDSNGSNIHDGLSFSFD